MNDRQRRLLQELGGELAGVLRGSLSRSPQERAASAARWEALRERAEAPAGDGFRDDLHEILGAAVDRLEALHDEILPDEPRPHRVRK
jgi:hypothetical protein